MDLIPDLTCPVCLELYTHPVILPCGHVLCRTPCAENILDQDYMRCPVCRDKCCVSAGMSSLPRVMSLESIIDKLKVSRQTREAANLDKSKLSNSETHLKIHRPCCLVNNTNVCLNDSRSCLDGKIQSFPSGKFSSQFMGILNLLGSPCSARQVSVSLEKMNFISGNSEQPNCVSACRSYPLDLLLNESLFKDMTSNDSLICNDYVYERSSNMVSRSRPITKFDLLSPSHRLTPLAVHTGCVANLCGADVCDAALYDTLTDQESAVHGCSAARSAERSVGAFDWTIINSDRPITSAVLSKSSLLNSSDEYFKFITEYNEPARNSQSVADYIETDLQTGIMAGKHVNITDSMLAIDYFPERLHQTEEGHGVDESPLHLGDPLVDSMGDASRPISPIVNRYKQPIKSKANDSGKAPPFQPIIDVPACARSSHSVVLAVAPPTAGDDVIDHYEVAYGSTEQMYLRMEEIHIARLDSGCHKGPKFIILENLCKRTQYFFNVTAVNLYGRSPCSDLIQCCTLDPVHCQLFEQVILETQSYAFSNSAIVVCPVKFESEVTTYRLLHRREADPSSGHGFAWTGTELSEGDRHQVVSLTPSTDYQFLVMAVSGHDGQCQISDKLMLKTLCPVSLK